MPLFRDENPALGPSTAVKELSGFGAGSPVVNYFKPCTREFISFAQGSATVPATQYVWVAPFACQILSVKVTLSALSTSGTLAITRTLQSALPSAPSTAANGSTILNVLSAASVNIGAAGITANQFTAPALSTASGSPLVMAAGDAIALQFGGTLTSLTGLLVQIEIAQIG